jgi:hypothetical protein
LTLQIKGRQKQEVNRFINTDLSRHILDKAAHGSRRPVNSAHKQALQDHTIEWSFGSPYQKPVELHYTLSKVRLRRINQHGYIHPLSRAATSNDKIRKRNEENPKPRKQDTLVILMLGESELGLSN